MAVIAVFAHPDTPLQAGSTVAAGQPVRACAVLTRDLVAPFTENKKILDLLPPSEEALGDACTYGAGRMQVFPGRGGKPTMSAQGLQPVSGTGDGGPEKLRRRRRAEPGGQPAGAERVTGKRRRMAIVQFRTPPAASGA